MYRHSDIRYIGENFMKVSTVNFFSYTKKIKLIMLKSICAKNSKFSSFHQTLLKTSCNFQYYQLDSLFQQTYIEDKNRNIISNTYWLLHCLQAK